MKSATDMALISQIGLLSIENKKQKDELTKYHRLDNFKATKNEEQPKPTEQIKVPEPV